MKNFPLDPYPRRKTPLKEWRPFLMALVAYAMVFVVAVMMTDYRNGFAVILIANSLINLAFFYVLLKP